MKVINSELIESLNASYSEYVDWVKQVFLIKHNTVLPPKISMKVDGGIFVNTMPCIIPSLNSFGVKVVSRYPKRVPSLVSEILLYEYTTGNLLAIMDGDWITAIRTGAVATLAIETLKAKTAKEYSFIGLGNTARATLLCLLSKKENKNDVLKVNLLKYKNQADLFIERFKDFKNVKFEIIDELESLIKKSDVIISCITNTDTQLGCDDWYKEGVLVVPIHTKGFQNCDLFFDKVYADDERHVDNFSNFSKFRSFCELSQVLLNPKLGRISQSDRILSYNIGLAIHDIYFACKIYKQLSSQAIEVEMNPESDKFWI